MKRVVSIVGIGRIGLPLALFIANSQYVVYGIDKDKQLIRTLKNGKMPFLEEGGNILSDTINITFFPTNSYSVIKKSQIIILTLGTPIDENMNPELEQINQALGRLLPYLQENQLLILRSTVSPSTTEYVREKIETATKLIVGKNIFLAFCPERIAQGLAIKEIKEIPQIIGGIDIVSTMKCEEFFKSLDISCLTTDATTAELAKLFTNMYRYISFAIANEFMVIAENFDRNIHEIVHLVNKGYKRNGLALPGFTAGPCLFKDGFFLVNENPFLDLITASWKINEAIPLFLIKKIKEKIPLKNKVILILGLAFKPEIDDIRESLSFKLRKALLFQHAKVLLHDPYVKKYSEQKIVKNFFQSIKKADIIIVATRHNYYVKQKKEIIKKIKPHAFVCDIWNIFEKNKLIFQKEL